LEVLFGQVRVGNFPQIAGPLNEDASRSVHHDFRDPLVENQMLDGRRNGRISSKPVAALRNQRFEFATPGGVIQDAVVLDDRR